jgi:6-phosphogluconolactonase
VNGTVEVVPSVPDAFAHLVAERLGAPRQGGFSLFLSGGPTAQQAYQRLAALTGPGGGGRTAVDWPGIDVYMGDERCVPPDHPDSNHRMVEEVLLDVVGPVGSDHPMYRSGPPEDEADRYQREIADLATFDLVHLGMGPDGHTASLFPGSTGLAVTDPHRLVVANRDPNATNPHDRISLTLPAITRARLVVFTVSGSSKRRAFEQVAAGADLPAARVVATEIIWLIDADVAGYAAGR